MSNRVLEPVNIIGFVTYNRSFVAWGNVTYLMPKLWHKTPKILKIEKA